MSPTLPSLVTRFAPSPTGLLHPGHVYAAHWAWRRAKESGGKFLLRFEDIDLSRCRSEFVDAIKEDLLWLGLPWDEAPIFQSQRIPAYNEALDKLQTLGVLYPCFCTRKDIHEEVGQMAAAPHGPDGPLYPGTCRNLSPDARQALITAGTHYSLRLDVAAALTLTGPLPWNDLRQGKQESQPEILGDVILARKDAGTSYHIAVVVDDAWQNVSLVTRGEDLFPSTHIHRLLQALLDLPVPEWEHHPLVRNDKGERLAKRNNDLAIATLREQGISPQKVLAMAEALAMINE